MLDVWMLFRWLLLFAVLTAVGAPLAAAAFPRFPSRGAAFALPAALLPTAVLVFWVGQVSFGRHTAVLSLLVVAALSTFSYRRGAEPDWRAVAGGYGVFLVGFGFLLLFRAYNAGITPAGGEQFLHFGLVKALLRTNALPPEDFWFAGRPLRYYYGTQLQVTVLTMLADTPARSGFNLGLSTFYGIMFVSAYGLAGAVTAHRGRSARLGGALGAFFVAVGGALTTAVRLAFGLLPTDLAVAYGRAPFGAIRHMEYETAVAEQSDPQQWGWFFTRYVVPDTLQEFPLYSFVKADLHGHTLANGYVVVAAALAFSYYLTPADERRRRLALVFGGLGLVAGVFGFMNTWSLPTVVGLAWLALAAADAHPATLFPDRVTDTLPAAVTGDDAGSGTATDRVRLLGAELWRVVLAGVLSTVVALVGVGIASPFLVFGHVPTNDGVGFLPPRTDLAPFLVIYGGILALFAGYLLYRAWPAVRAHSTVETAVVALAGLVAAVVLVTVADFAVLAVTGPILLVAWWLVRTGRIGFEGVLLVAGVGLLLSMEVVYARVWPPTQERWNTTLKVAVQGWTLAGVAAGASAGLVLSEARETLSGHLEADATGTATPVDGGRPGAGGRSRWSTLAVAGLVVAVVLASAPFAALTINSQIVEDEFDRNEDRTLDGLSVHDRFKPDRMAAIYWLDDRQGTPTIVEAPGRRTYSFTNPASTLTGVPTVVGWDHQQGYRGIDAFERRAAQVDDVYVGTWANASRTLRQYDVQYVYVGPNEREQYGDSMRDFRNRSALSVAFENDAVTIYAVDHAELVGDGDGAAATESTSGAQERREVR
ncbi:DUF2298 domain-containing protein [Haloarchaeobius sp. HRN-SO-5]|uniref:DUF2298 domain-containing protein n=1 Tax=Haloarchaeobius sp. HRN-SO-5 TaxID=3446118 RepID=UPI003EBFC79B